ncbi:unnamed protein product [Closterium sp. NIES-54]
MPACPRACVPTCLRARVPACLRACVPACLRACVPACLRACVPACLRACVPACPRACVPACLRACVPACPRACILQSLFFSLCLGAWWHGGREESFFNIRRHVNPATTIVQSWLKTDQLANMAAWGFRIIHTNAGGGWYLDSLQSRWEHAYREDPADLVLQVERERMESEGEGGEGGEGGDVWSGDGGSGGAGVRRRVLEWTAGGRGGEEGETRREEEKRRRWEELEDLAERVVVGGEVCAWSERIDPSQLMATVWPRAAAMAERLWSPKAYVDSTRDGPHDRMHMFRCLLVQRGIASAPVDNPFARSEPVLPGSCFKQ